MYCLCVNVYCHRVTTQLCVNVYCHRLTTQLCVNVYCHQLTTQLQLINIIWCVSFYCVTSFPLKNYSPHSTRTEPLSLMLIHSYLLNFNVCIFNKNSTNAVMKCPRTSHIIFVSYSCHQQSTQCKTPQILGAKSPWPGPYTML
jgi:hypothetical protein